MTTVTGTGTGPPPGSGDAGPGAPAPGSAPTTRRRRLVAHPTRWVAGAVVVALVVVAIVAATRPSEEATSIQSPLVGHRAPPVTGTDLRGHAFTLADDRGHWTYVNFFASWCPPCQDEEQALVDFDFRQSRQTSGARMVSVVFNDTVQDARSFVSQWGVRWPVVPDHGGAIANSYGVAAPPMTFLVDPSGVVVGTWEGPVTVAQLDQLLKAGKSGQLVDGGT